MAFDIAQWHATLTPQEKKELGILAICKTHFLERDQYAGHDLLTLSRYVDGAAMTWTESKDIDRLLKSVQRLTDAGKIKACLRAMQQAGTPWEIVHKDGIKPFLRLQTHAYEYESKTA